MDVIEEFKRKTPEEALAGAGGYYSSEKSIQELRELNVPDGVIVVAIEYAKGINDIVTPAFLSKVGRRWNDLGIKTIEEAVTQAREDAAALLAFRQRQKIQAMRKFVDDEHLTTLDRLIIKHLSRGGLQSNHERNEFTTVLADIFDTDENEILSAAERLYKLGYIEEPNPLLKDDRPPLLITLRWEFCGMFDNLSEEK